MIINGDVGEGFADSQFIPLLDIANIACGFHAGDKQTILRAIILAKNSKVKISAHPSYNDSKNFGRKSIFTSPEILTKDLLQQLTLLSKLCQNNKVTIEFIKPHGALYNDLVKNDLIFATVAKVITKFNPKLKWIFMASNDNQKFLEMAKKYKLQLFFESFADRAYQNFKLVSRNLPNSVIINPPEIVKRYLAFKAKKPVLDYSGKLFSLTADTICFHGDNNASVEALKTIKKDE